MCPCVSCWIQTLDTVVVHAQYLNCRLSDSFFLICHRDQKHNLFLTLLMHDYFFSDTHSLYLHDSAYSSVYSCLHCLVGAPPLLHWIHLVLTRIEEMELLCLPQQQDSAKLLQNFQTFSAKENANECWCPSSSWCVNMSQAVDGDKQSCCIRGGHSEMS